MAIHIKDTERKNNPNAPEGKPFRLLGISESGEAFFYWSAQPGEYAAYYGPNYDPVWGILTCGTGKRMDAKNRAFIADHQTAIELERSVGFRPCGNCNKKELARWKQTKE